MKHTRLFAGVLCIWTLTALVLALCPVVSEGYADEEGESQDKLAIEELQREKMPLLYGSGFGEDNPDWVFSECKRLRTLGFFKHDVYRLHDWAMFHPECDEDGCIVSMRVSRLAVAARFILHLNRMSPSAKRALVENGESAAFLSRFLIEYRGELSALATREDLNKIVRVRGEHALLFLRALGSFDGRVSLVWEETHEY